MGVALEYEMLRSASRLTPAELAAGVKSRGTPTLGEPSEVSAPRPRRVTVTDTSAVVDFLLGAGVADRFRR